MGWRNHSSTPCAPGQDSMWECLIPCPKTYDSQEVTPLGHSGKS